MTATPLDSPTTTSASTQALDALPAGVHPAPDALPAAPATGCYLMVADDAGESDGPLLPLVRPITRIGRSFAAHVQLDDPGVSRRHALVMLRQGRVRIVDDRSANGTWVNGRRVVDAELRDGDVIAIGRVTLVFVDGGRG